MVKKNVLVTLATGKQGGAICDAFVKDGGFEVFGTSRNGTNPKLLAKGVTPVEFQYNHEESMLAALQVSKPASK